MTVLKRVLTVLTLALAAASPLAAQNLFAPVLRVDERVITGFELQQRARMLELFRSPGDPEEEARDALIDERLQMAEARRMGIAVTEQEVREGMEEFAGRADLSAEELVAELAGAGVEVQTFRDFVRAGVAWRKVVRARFGGDTNISQRDIDLEIDRRETASDVRVLLSELVLPANTPQNKARSEALLPQLRQIETPAGFAAAVREYSASPSRERGGRIDWLPLGRLPQNIRPLVLTLRPGETTPPIRVPNAIVLFQLRAIEEVPQEGRTTALDYAAFYIPGGRTPETLARAAEIEAAVDTCDDLYGVAEGLPPERLQRDRLPLAEVPGDVALELAKLDDGEVSTALTRAGGQTLVFLMLCERSVQREDPIDRAAIGRALTNRTVAGKAANYLAELRANAVILEP